MTVQCDETVLLDAWLRHHAHLFGFENLAVHDEGSTEPATLALLTRAERAGVEVHRQPGAAVDLAPSGCDFMLPLACDEFLAVFTDDGVSCRRDPIHAELDAFRGKREALAYGPGLLDVAGDGCEFAIGSVQTCIVPAAALGSMEVSRAMRAKPAERSRGTALTCLRFGGETRESDVPRIIFQGFGALLEAFGVHSARLGSPVATPRGAVDDAVWVKPAPTARAVRFKADAYRRAHADVAATDWKPFLHYVAMGLREGRSAY